MVELPLLTVGFYETIPTSNHTKQVSDNQLEGQFLVINMFLRVQDLC
jgi:hypothetical protein